MKRIIVGLALALLTLVAISSFSHAQCAQRKYSNTFLKDPCSVPGNRYRCVFSCECVTQVPICPAGNGCVELIARMWVCKEPGSQYCGPTGSPSVGVWPTAHTTAINNIDIGVWSGEQTVVSPGRTELVSWHSNNGAGPAMIFVIEEQ